VRLDVGDRAAGLNGRAGIDVRLDDDAVLLANDVDRFSLLVLEADDHVALAHGVAAAAVLGDYAVARCQQAADALLP
jgi:hypothetical protein